MIVKIHFFFKMNEWMNQSINYSSVSRTAHPPLNIYPPLCPVCYFFTLYEKIYCIFNLRLKPTNIMTFLSTTWNCKQLGLKAIALKMCNDIGLRLSTRYLLVCCKLQANYAVKWGEKLKSFLNIDTKSVFRSLWPGRAASSDLAVYPLSLEY